MPVNASICASSKSGASKVVFLGGAMRTACQCRPPPSHARPPLCPHPGSPTTPTAGSPRRQPQRRAAAGKPPPSTAPHSRPDRRWDHTSPLATTPQVNTLQDAVTYFIFPARSATGSFNCVSPAASQTSNKGSKVQIQIFSFDSQLPFQPSESTIPPVRMGREERKSEACLRKQRLKSV